MPVFYRKIPNRNEYLINIRGVIGENVKGAEIADLIDTLNLEGVDRIIEVINSNGGYLEDGFNIIQANLQSNTTIETINAGAAGSIAAVILASGDVRKAYDNSYALIHDIQISGETLENIKDPILKENMIKVKNTLVKTLVDACKQPEKKIFELMTRETAFSAKEQLEIGLVDKVIKSRIKPPKTRNLSLSEIVNYFDSNKQSIYDFNNLKTSKMDLNNLTNHLKLNSDANESSILDAVKAIENKAETFKNQALENKKDLEKLQGEKTELENRLNQANEKLKAFNDTAVKNAVDAAISSGKFDESQRDDLTEKATKDLDFFNDMVNAIPKPVGSVMQEITNTTKNPENHGNNPPKSKTDQLAEKWDYMQKNEPEKLKQLEISNNAEYKELFEAYWCEPYKKGN